MSGGASREGAQGSSECPVCLEAFSPLASSKRVPRVLHCGHSVCSACLNSMIRAEDAHRSSPITCPLCRKRTRAMLSELPVNYSLIESLCKEGANKSANVGGGCIPAQALADLLLFDSDTLSKRAATSMDEASVSSGSNAAADGGGAGAADGGAGGAVAPCEECSLVAMDVYCMDCDHPFCNACFAKLHPRDSKLMGAHKTSMSSTSAPIVAAFGGSSSGHSGSSLSDSGSLPMQMCPTHRRPCELYCRVHQEAICHHCAFTDEHKGHQDKIGLLSQFVRELRAAMEHAERELQAHKTELLAVQYKASTADVQLPLAVAEATSQVRARIEELVQVLRQREEALVQHITRLGEGRATDLRNVLSECTGSILGVDSAMLTISPLPAGSSATPTVGAVALLTDRELLSFARSGVVRHTVCALVRAHKTIASRFRCVRRGGGSGGGGGGGGAGAHGGARATGAGGTAAAARVRGGEEEEEGEEGEDGEEDADAVEEEFEIPVHLPAAQDLERLIRDYGRVGGDGGRQAVAEGGGEARAEGTGLLERGRPGETVEQMRDRFAFQLALQREQERYRGSTTPVQLAVMAAIRFHVESRATDPHRSPGLRVLEFFRLNPFYPLEQVREAVEALLADGYLYSTIDFEHFRLTDM